MSKNNFSATHVKAKPQILYKFKSKHHNKLQQKKLLLQKQSRVFCAFQLNQMPKALLAYYKLGSRKNNIKPDNLPKKQNSLPIQEKQQDLNPLESLTLEPPKDPETQTDQTFCVCKRPYSDGELMFKCEGFCVNWYHPACIGLQASQIERQKNNFKERWYCPTCCERAMRIANAQPVIRKEMNKAKIN